MLDGRFVDRERERAGFRQARLGKDAFVCAHRRRNWCVQGRRVMFSPCSLLVQDLLAAKRDLRLPRLKRLAGYED